MTQTTALPRWTYYYRPDGRHPWRKVGESDTEAGAWRLLFSDRRGGDKTIASPGRDPQTEKKPR